MDWKEIGNFAAVLLIASAVLVLLRAAYAYATRLNAHGPDRQARAAAQAAARNEILADLDAGRLPIKWTRNVRDQLPFIMQKSEHLVYVWAQTQYHTTRRVFHGRSAGVSVRVVKGVTVRGGGSRGVPTDELTLADANGVLALTTKHLYFTSRRPDGKSFRIRLNKIAALACGPLGVSVTRDTASAKPENFAPFGPSQVPDVGPETPDFAHALIRAVAQWQDDPPEWKHDPEDAPNADGEAGLAAVEAAAEGGTE